MEASRNRWVVPTQENNREKWSFLLKDAREDKQGGTTGVFVKSLSSLLQCFRKGRGFFIARLLPRQTRLKEFHTMAISSMGSQTHTNPAHATTVVTSSALELALHKIASVDVPQGKHIALA